MPEQSGKRNSTTCLTQPGSAHERPSYNKKGTTSDLVLVPEFRGDKVTKYRKRVSLFQGTEKGHFLTQ